MNEDEVITVEADPTPLAEKPAGDLTLAEIAHLYQDRKVATSLKMEAGIDDVVNRLTEIRGLVAKYNAAVTSVAASPLNSDATSLELITVGRAGLDTKIRPVIDLMIAEMEAATALPVPEGNTDDTLAGGNSDIPAA